MLGAFEQDYQPAGLHSRVGGGLLAD